MASLAGQPLHRLVIAALFILLLLMLDSGAAIGLTAWRHGWRPVAYLYGTGFAASVVL
eukprot:gene12710-10893_t